MEVVVYNSSTLVERDYHFQRPEKARKHGKKGVAARDDWPEESFSGCAKAGQMARIPYQI